MKKYVAIELLPKLKKQDWENYCKFEMSESKDIHMVQKKVKDLKNGYSCQQYPIKLATNIFPTSSQKAEAFADFVAKNSSSSSLDTKTLTYRQTEEKKDAYKDPNPENDH